MDKKITHSEIDLSIIIPMYNVEHYIRRCLDSIFSQIYKGKIEVIVVDDGSTDTSASLVKNYQKKEPRLILLQNNVNLKLSRTRAIGIANSNGKYILHVDSDDWLLPGSINSVMEEATRSNADVIVFNYVKEDKYGNIRPIDVTSPYDNDYEKSKLINLFYGSVWNKLAKRSLVEKMIIGESSINNGEDLLYSTELFLRAKTFYLSKNYYYTYFTSDTSLTNSANLINFTLNQKLVNDHLNKIFLFYEVPKYYRENLIRYFTNIFILEVAKSHILKNKIHYNFNKSQIDNLTLLKKNDRVFIKICLRFKIVAFFALWRYYGSRMAGRFLINYYKK